MIAQECNLEVGEFIHTIGDAHIYHNHMKQVKTQLVRVPKVMPTLWLNPEVKSVFNFKYDDVKIMNYQSHPRIKAKVAV